MAKVLLAWCLGSGLGHIRKLVPLAQRLTQDGHECVVAAHSFETIYPIIRPAVEQGLSFIAAPIPQSLRTKRPGYSTFADVLWTCGFSAPDRLAGEVSAWDGILDVVQPDLAVIESAPVLNLACHGRVPTLSIGTGYALPPAKDHAFPPMKPGAKGGVRIGEVMGVIAEVQRRRGRPPLDDVPSLLAGARVVASLPELDPYRSLRPAEERGLAFDPLLPIAAQAGPAVGKRIFAYLHGEFAGLPQALAGLGGSGAQVECFVARADDGIRDMAKQHGIALHATPQPFTEALPRNALVVHHGGAGTCEAALASGRFQLIVPRHGEGLMNAEALAKAGVAGVIRKAPDLGAACRRALADLDNLDGRTRSVAGRIHGRGDPTAFAAALEHCKTLLG